MIDGSTAALALGLVTGFGGVGMAVRFSWQASEAWELATAAARHADELVAHDDERSALWASDRRELAARESELVAERQVAAYLFDENQDLRYQLRRALDLPQEGSSHNLVPTSGVEVANAVGELLGRDDIDRAEATFAKVQRVVRDTAVEPLDRPDAAEDNYDWLILGTHPEEDARE